MSEVQNEVKDSAAVEILRKRVREIDRLITQASEAIAESKNHIAETMNKRAELYSQRDEIEDALIALKGGVA